MDYFETAKQIVREDAISKGYVTEADRVKAEDDRVSPIVKRLKEEMKRRPKWDFSTTVEVITDVDNYKIEIGISYDAVYEPAYISGLPENCYPDSSEMDLTGLVILDDLPEGITEKMVRDAAEEANDRITEEAWQDFDDKRSNHD